jgi:hypothetical protein
MSRREGPAWASAVRTDLVGYLVVIVPERDRLGGLVPALAAMVHDGPIRILDLVVIARDRGGTVRIEEVEDVESLAGLRDIDCVVGGLLTDDDARAAAVAIGPDDVGIVLVTEQRWALPLANAASEMGGHIVAGERIPRGRVEAVLREHRGGQ